jgi:hypothetical protein
MLLNGDTTAYFTDQTIAAKMTEGNNFRITEHYYRTLKMLPELAEAACNTGLAFIIDSTMSDRASIFAAMDKINSHNAGIEDGDRYHTSAIICFPENPDKAVEAVVARAKEVGRVIDPENALNSQQKFRTGFNELWPNLTQRVEFSLLCTLDNNAEKPSLKPIYSQGEPFYGAKMTLGIHAPKDDAATISRHDFLAEPIAASRAANKR